MSSKYRPAWLMFLLLAACATAPSTPAKLVDWRTLPHLPECSVDAVLLQADTLKLTPRQVDTLESLAVPQRQLVHDMREQMAQKRAEYARADNAGPRLPDSARSAGMSRGGGSGLGGHPRPRGPDFSAEHKLALERIDDADTASFMLALETLTPGQHEQAVKIASKYRADLFERRELIRQQAGDVDL